MSETNGNGENGVSKNGKYHPPINNLGAVQKKEKSYLGTADACGARVKNRPGAFCKNPAMPNGRCRMHGGKSPGAPRGNKNALRHGRYTSDAIERRREVAALIKAARQLSGGR